jgi:protein-disulfide isomerase
MRIFSRANLLAVIISLLLPAAALAQSPRMDHVSTNSPKLMSGVGTPPAASASPRPSKPFTYTPDPLDIVVGSPKAPVTIVEYASLSCPHCAHFFIETFPALKKQYIDTGKARMVYRHFPLNQPALVAAKLVSCLPAPQQEEFLKVLFTMQDQWAADAQPQAALANIVSVGGVSRDQFNKCEADKDLENRILKERLAADNNGWVSSTPTFYVNGVKIEGAQELPAFAKVIDPMLAKK